MSRRLTITLTDEEYAALEQRAEAERRSVRDMAAWLVTKPEAFRWTPDWTWRPPTYLPPGTFRIMSAGCLACANPGGSFYHTCHISTTNLCHADTSTSVEH